MADSFLQRIPTLSEAELRGYLDGHRRYRREAVEAAAAELARRGLAVPAEALAAVRAQVADRDALAEAWRARPGFLRDGRGPRLGRIRAISAALLGTGAAAGLLLYRRALAAVPPPFDLEPTDSKSYLRQVEMMGGKANLLASEFRLWFAGLWSGTRLGWTVFWLGAVAAGIFYLAATQAGMISERRKG